MSIYLDKINKDSLPNHIAIIMDGNGRWAKRVGKSRILGHKQGVKTVRTIIEASVRLKIKHLTLYTFSTENWQRPKTEVKALMELLASTIKSEIEELCGNNVKISLIGDLKKFPEKNYSKLMNAVEKTKDNNGLNVILALSYSSKWDIINAVKNIVSLAENGKILPENIDENLFKNNLSTSAFPSPELLIRTGGDFRISNFLLWELAYTELYFTNKLWPEFSEEDFYTAIIDYQERERRFGKVSEQLSV